MPSKRFWYRNLSFMISNERILILDRCVLIDEFYKVLQENDVIILTLPLADHRKMYHLIDKTAIPAMKGNAITMNVARWAIID